LEDGVSVREVVMFECRRVDYGRHAKGDVLAKDVEILRFMDGVIHIVGSGIVVEKKVLIPDV
jgi:hypothetical protein